ncbi:unnamed protein product [Paramecium primaurelia]|uniref:Uncharacterized protein n=1 Tax=Paramecium primaurelia TaxID=5886 RepID=A0A8S1PIE8_PARPR|nr:unnamed protein product [Paramecium primaurelia]
MIQLQQFDHNFFEINQIIKLNDRIQNTKILKNQINSFLTKRLQQSVLNEQFQQLQQNNCKLDNDQAQIIQNIITVQDKLKEQQKNCENEQGIFSQNFELITHYLERLKTHLNSISFCNSIQKEFQIKTNEKIFNLEKDKMRIKNQRNSVKSFQSILLNPYQPQFNSNCKLAAYQVVKPKVVSAPQGGFGLAVMKPPLPKDKKFIKWAGIGICHLQTAQGFHYDMNENYSQKNHNVYITSTGGYRISSYQGYSVLEQTLLLVKIASFIVNMILKQYIKFITLKCIQNNNQDGNTYQMDIANNNLEMSLCVMLYGTAEIEQI